MKELGISAIVDMRSTLIKNMDELKGFKVLQLPTVDRTPPSIENLYKGAKFIDEEINRGGIVYAHCRYGEGRGPSVAIAYLILTGKSFEQAYEEIKRVRCFIRPSLAQIERLREFEKLYGKNS
jgi:protein-tyrosine phosphatase